MLRARSDIRTSVKPAGRKPEEVPCLTQTNTKYFSPFCYPPQYCVEELASNYCLSSSAFYFPFQTVSEEKFSLPLLGKRAV